MDLGLRGKSALVTGASQSIGRKIALALAQEGARVSVIARREKVLKQVVEEMGGSKAGHAFVATDLMPEGAPTLAVENLAERQGGIEIVVHSIGGTLEVRDPLSPVDVWSRVWRYNVGIAIEINGILVPQMLEMKWGRVIHISSMSGVDYRGSGPYAAAKAYVNAYVNSFGRAVAAEGVVVSGLMPGAILEKGNNWDFKNREVPVMVEDFLRHHQAIGRLGKAEEIIPFVLLLASELNTFATGSMLQVHGGAM